MTVLCLVYAPVAFSALTLLVGRQERHPVSKKIWANRLTRGWSGKKSRKTVVVVVMVGLMFTDTERKIQPVTPPWLKRRDELETVHK